MTLEEGIKERLHKRINELPDTPETELLLDKVQRILEGTLDAASFVAASLTMWAC